MNMSRRLRGSEESAADRDSKGWAVSKRDLGSLNTSMKTVYLIALASLLESAHVRGSHREHETDYYFTSFYFCLLYVLQVLWKRSMILLQICFQM